MWLHVVQWRYGNVMIMVCPIFFYYQCSIQHLNYFPISFSKIYKLWWFSIAAFKSVFKRQMSQIETSVWIIFRILSWDHSVICLKDNRWFNPRDTDWSRLILCRSKTSMEGKLKRILHHKLLIDDVKIWVRQRTVI